ncbi:MAG TPA: hypothetical protein DIC34_06110 [Treponema sp.]|nr:MAG: hypothetical protein A2413_01810 [Treponema sp. RIFOXYC1_FULL_61_9]HCM26109.1 hypothetical protein [Treponema sp.]
MKFRDRLLLGFGLVILILASLVAADLYLMRRASENLRSIAEHKIDAREAVEESARIILRMRADILDALFVGGRTEAEAAAELEANARAFHRAMDELEVISPDEPSFRNLRFAFNSYYVFAGTLLSEGAGAPRAASIDATRKFKENQTFLMTLVEGALGAVERDFLLSLRGLDEELRTIVGGSIVATVAAVLSAVLVALYLANRLTRPIEDLTSLARKVAAGDFGGRAWVPRPHGEVAILSSAFNAMLDEIQRYADGMEAKVRMRTEEYERTNENLAAVNARLEAAFADLKATQDRLNLEGRLASLGRLIAGIAHELNTPLGAIASSNRAIAMELAVVLPDFPEILADMDADESAFYRGCVLRTLDGSVLHDARRERARRRSLGADLRAAGCAESGRIAEILAELGFDAIPPALPAFLASGRALPLLEFIARSAAIGRSCGIVELGVMKATRAVKALGTYIGRGGDSESVVVDVRAQLAAAVEASIGTGDRTSRRDIAVEWNGDGSALVRGDAGELARVWSILLSNALYAMADAGLLRLATYLERERVIVIVEDDGAGIPPEVRGRLFEPFFTTKPEGEGLGLGLHMARAIVGRHGGSIAFESRPGRTAFTVNLPAAERTDNTRI